MKTLQLALLCLLVAILCSWPVERAAAHPPDQHQQYHTIALTSDGVRLTWQIAVAPLLAPGIWQTADLNGDDSVSSAEAMAWATGVVPHVHGRLDDAILPWSLDSVTWPQSFGAMQAGDEGIEMALHAAWPAALAGEHRLILSNGFDPSHSASWFAVEPGGPFEIVHSVADESTRFVVDFEPADNAISSGQQAQARLPLTANRLTAPSEPSGSAALRQLSALLQTRATTPAFYAVAFFVALALGALHALTPGHGKTVVAAYLVGSRGTNLHAVSLGAVTTVTHTGSVLLIGIVALLASRFFVPNDLFSLLEMASGVLIILLGANLLYRRWYEFKRGDLPHDHDHLHDNDHAAHHGTDQGTHPHDHGHSLVAETGRITWRSLLALGVSGGMVPCPDAIAILLLAVALQRIGLGLALIVSFSLGLAVVLTAIGLTMLHSRRLFARLSAFERVSPVLPMVSASMVLLLGVVLTVRSL